MLNIGNKIETLRSAQAGSFVRMSSETLGRVRRNDLPKKDVLQVARIAGVMAAKKTPELIPFCHPIMLDGVEVECTLMEDGVDIKATVQTCGKTGVEMEALTAASVAALTVYDMLKPIDGSMEIVATKLIFKKGGKSDFACRAPRNFKAAVIVTSDGSAQGKREDRSGKIIAERLKEMQVEDVDYRILPDEVDLIRNELLKYCEQGFDLVITSGGTGLGPRDVTVEATQEVIEREMPAVMQAMRAYGQQRTPYAMLSRGVAGVRGQCVILNLPGSSRGAQESMDAVFPALFHVYPMLQGGGH